MALPIFLSIPHLPVLGINLLGLVILHRPGMTETTRVHELIHTPQWRELLIIGFPVVYAWDWLHAFTRCWSFWGAYMRIRIEQEAYDHQDDPTWPETRPRFAWREYSVHEKDDNPEA